MEVGDASSGAALERVLGVLVEPAAGPARAPRAHAARGDALRAAARGRRLARAGRLPRGARRPRAHPAGAVGAAGCCCPRRPARCGWPSSASARPRASRATLLDQGRAGRAARGCGRRSRRCARWPGRDAALRAVCVDPDSRVPERRVVLAPDPGVIARDRACAEPAPARRACAGARASRPRWTAKRSSRCASPGWSRTAGGRAGRCAAATGSWSARGGATWSSSTTCARGRWFVQGLAEMAATPPYVELHCHSAYSFLDGVSLPRGAGPARGRARLRGARADRPQLGLRLDGAGPDAPPTTGCGRSTAPRSTSTGERGAAADAAGEARPATSRCSCATSAAGATSAGSSPSPTRTPARAPAGASWASPRSDAAGGARPRRGPRLPDRLRRAIGARRRREASRRRRRLLDAFGPERLYVELQRPYARHDRARNRALAALARRLGVRCVATGDVHAHARARAELQDAFVALRHHATLDASEPLRRGNHSHVMSTPQAMASRFADHPEAVRETLALAERLTFDLTRDLGYRYPGAEDEGASRRLAELCRARLEERYGPARAPARRARAGAAATEAAARAWSRSCEVIDRLGLAGFFLLHHDMLELAREVAVEVRGPDSVRALLAPGRGRGSSVSSIVCYLTGLSHIDPIANGLALGRFLHEDLHGLPDIDLDFPRDIRERLIPRVHERYGRDRAALVAAFPTFRARGAIRELGKVLGLPAGRDRAGGARRRRLRARRSERDLDVGARRRARRRRRPRGRARGRASASERWRWLARLVEQAYGLPRHLSQHSGRDDHRDAAADRLLPGRAGGDGGQADGAVGQGLLRRRRLPEDRPAGAGDALGGRALRRGDRARARRADRPLAHPLRRPARPSGRSARPTRSASSRSRAARRCSRCCAPGRGTSRTSRSRWRSCGPARSRAARSTPTSSAASACARTPPTRSPTSTRRSSRSCGRRSARSSSRTR